MRDTGSRRCVGRRKSPLRGTQEVAIAWHAGGRNCIGRRRQLLPNDDVIRRRGIWSRCGITQPSCGESPPVPRLLHSSPAVSCLVYRSSPMSSSTLFTCSVKLPPVSSLLHSSSAVSSLVYRSPPVSGLLYLSSAVSSLVCRSPPVSNLQHLSPAVSSLVNWSSPVSSREHASLPSTSLPICYARQFADRATLPNAVLLTVSY